MREKRRENRGASTLPVGEREKSGSYNEELKEKRDTRERKRWDRVDALAKRKVRDEDGSLIKSPLQLQSRTPLGTSLLVISIPVVRYFFFRHPIINATAPTPAPLSNPVFISNHDCSNRVDRVVLNNV